MLTTPRGRSPLWMRIGTLLVALAIVVLAGMLASCGGDGNATPPPPTVIRADETPSPEGPTATPTPTATPGAEGYPGPAPTQPPAESGYPFQDATPTPAAAYPGK